MHSKVHVPIVITLLYSMSYGSNLRQTSDLYVNSTDFVPGLLEQICPYVDICDRDATSATIKPNGPVRKGLISCCTGCSCHPDCEQELNCCFPDKVDNNKADNPVSMYQCLPTRTGAPADHFYTLVPAYITVIHAPASGCIKQTPVKTQTGEFVLPSCDVTNETIFDSYFPVYSRSRDKIYKNGKCAMCHGVRDGRFFEPLLICDESKSSMSDRMSVFETGRLSDNCHFDFVYSDPSLLTSRRCYRNVIDTCLTNKTRIPHDINVPGMNIDLMTDLCESSVFSTFVSRGVAYRNIFCRLCGEDEHVGLFCRIDRAEKTNDKVFKTILDHSVVLNKKMLKNQAKHPQACLYDANKKNKISCRNVYCPSGRLRDVTGRCRFVSKRWQMPFVEIVLSLPTAGQEDIRNINNLAGIEIEQILLEKTPWPRDWRLFSIRGTNVTECGRDILIIALFKTEGDTQETVRQIQTSMILPWPVVFDGTTVMLKQTFLRTPLVSPKGVIIPTGILILRENSSGCSETHWVTLRRSTVPLNTPTVVKKLILCNQVQLNRTEFTLMSPDQYIESNITRRILHANEFDLVTVDDWYHARVCLSDTVLTVRGVNFGTSLVSTRNIDLDLCFVTVVLLVNKPLWFL